MSLSVANASPVSYRLQLASVNLLKPADVQTLKATGIIQLQHMDSLSARVIIHSVQPRKACSSFAGEVYPPDIRLLLVFGLGKAGNLFHTILVHTIWRFALFSSVLEQLLTGEQITLAL